MALFEIKGSKSVQARAPDVKESPDQQKLNSLIAQIEEIEKSIGHKYVEAHADDDAIDELFSDDIKRIKDIKSEKEQLEVKLLVLSGKKKCPECGSQIEFSSLYCNACGAKQVELNISEIIGGKLCANCGSVVDGDALFCTSCGSKLD